MNTTTRLDLVIGMILVAVAATMADTTASMAERLFPPAAGWVYLPVALGALVAILTGIFYLTGSRSRRPFVYAVAGWILSPLLLALAWWAHDAAALFADGNSFSLAVRLLLPWIAVGVVVVLPVLIVGRAGDFLLRPAPPRSALDKA